MADVTEITPYDYTGHKTLTGKGSVEGKSTNVFVEELIHALRVVLWVWDADAGENVRMQQPLTAGELKTSKNIPETRLAYDGSNNVEYVGENETLGAATSATDWTITKITYTSGQVTRVQVQETSWDDRELGW